MGFQEQRWWDRDVLLLVVLSCSLTFIFGFDRCCLLVAFLQGRVDVLGDVVNLVLHLREALDSINKQTIISNLRYYKQ